MRFDDSLLEVPRLSPRQDTWLHSVGGLVAFLNFLLLTVSFSGASFSVAWLARIIGWFLVARALTPMSPICSARLLSLHGNRGCLLDVWFYIDYPCLVSDPAVPATITSLFVIWTILITLIILICIIAVRILEWGWDLTFCNVQLLRCDCLDDRLLAIVGCWYCFLRILLHLVVCLLGVWLRRVTRVRASPPFLNFVNVCRSH